MKESDTNIALPVEQQPVSLEHQCWSCGDMRAKRFCSSCGKVQPPMPVDYFSFFGVERKLNLNLAALERDFYRLSRHLHPDANAQASGNEQLWSLEVTSQLNDAYRTLRDPISRTEYLLKLEGRELDEQSKNASDKARATGQQKKQTVPPEMLEEVFELNMALEEARMNRKMGDRDADLEQQLQQQKTDLQARMNSLMDELKRAWAEWDLLVSRKLIGHTDRERVLGKLVDILNRRTYIRNLVREVNDVLDS